MHSQLHWHLQDIFPMWPNLYSVEFTGKTASQNQRYWGTCSRHATFLNTALAFTNFEFL